VTGPWGASRVPDGSTATRLPRSRRSGPRFAAGPLCDGDQARSAAGGAEPGELLVVSGPDDSAGPHHAPPSSSSSWTADPTTGRSARASECGACGRCPASGDFGAGETGVEVTVQPTTAGRADAPTAVYISALGPEPEPGRFLEGRSDVQLQDKVWALPFTRLGPDLLTTRLRSLRARRRLGRRSKARRTRLRPRHTTS